MTGPALLWTDIEASGLEENLHYLLEVGFRVTDADLKTLAERSWVIWWSNIGSIRMRASEQVQAMHAASGLWDECVRSREDGGAGGTEWPLGDGLAGEMTRWLGDHGAKGLPLAGSTVGFDRRWLNHWLPGFSGIPHYRSVDVSSLKVLFDLWATDEQKAARAELKPMKRHRVMPDLDDSIAELRFYRGVLGFGDLAEELRQERLRHQIAEAEAAILRTEVERLSALVEMLTGVIDIVVPPAEMPAPGPEGLCLCGDAQHPDGPCPRSACGCQQGRPSGR